MRIFLSSFFLVMTINAARAAEPPSVDLGADKFDARECLSAFRDQCINNQCMNSEDTDCQDKCQSLAEDKCEEKTEE